MKTKSPARTGLPAVVALLAAAPAFAARAVDEDVLPAAPNVQIVDAASRTMYLVILVLVVLILLPVAFLVYRRLFGAVQGATAEAGAGPARDPLAGAQAEEARGNLSAAAERYEAAGDKLKAAACWERGRDLARAAECYEAGGELEKAAQLHVRSGGALRAAGIYMRTKNYIEAAKIFRNKGDHLRAAQALENFGNNVAAAREYTEAGNHARAARLLEEERMYAEAAEAYQPLLGGAEATPQSADRHATYATLLARAGDKERAATIFRQVLAAVPGHPQAGSGLLRLQARAAQAPAAAATAASLSTAASPSSAAAAATAAAPPPKPIPIAPEDVECEFLEPGTPETADAGDPLKRVFTLRSMIQAGRMEPRYSMRLWVQVMREVADRHRANQVLGCVTPDSITIDMENNTRVEAPADRPAVYVAPEVQAGLPPDRQADIYSMGVVLYELVAGSTAQLGKKRAGELFGDVPAWLDELIEHCTEKNLTRRYRTAEEVSAALLRLKNAAVE